MRLAVIIALLNHFFDNVSQSKTANSYFTTKSIFEGGFCKIRLQPFISLPNHFKSCSQNETANNYFTIKPLFDECFTK